MGELAATVKRAAKRDVLKFWYLVVYKVRFNLRSEAAQSYLSYAWWVLDPLLLLAIYYMVFHILLNRGHGDFAPFLMSSWISKMARSCLLSAK